MKSTKKISYITDIQGKKQSVVLPVDVYEEMLEDIHDLVTVAERKKEKPVPLSDFKKRLQKAGLV